MNTPRVLLIDDDRVSSDAVRELLEQGGYSVARAADGAEGLKLAAEFKPDIILLDLILPTTSGIAICAELRRMPTVRRAPIVVLTSRDDPEHIARAFAAGADDYITKPVRRYELLPRLGAHLRSKRVLNELEEQTRDRKLLLELSNTLSSRLEIRQILRMVATKLAEAIKVDRCSIILVDRDNVNGFVVAASEDPKVEDLQIELANYPEIHEVIETRSPLVVSDADSHPLFETRRVSMNAASVRASILFPMVVGDAVIGVLLLRSASTLSELSARELDFGQTVASATAIAVRNARLFESIAREQVELDVQAREVQEQLETVRRFRDFMDSAAYGMLTIDAKGRATYTNKVAADMLGLSEGDDFFSLLDFAGRDQVLAAQNALEHSHAAPTFDLPVHVQGARKLLAVATSRVIERGGGTLLVVNDVTHVRQTEAELKRTKDFLESLIDGSADPIIAADVSGTIIIFNRAAELALGYSAEEVLGKQPMAIIYPDGVAAEIDRQLRSHEFGGRGRLGAQRRDIVGKTGERIPVMFTAALIYLDQDPVATVGVFSDLRDRLRMESKLNLATEKLQMSEKQAVIAELAGTAAHELNQPLTSIMGYAELLKRKLVGTPEHRAVEIIFNEADRMAEIVRKVGRITRYETKTYVGSTRIVDLDRSVESDTDKKD